MAFHLFRVLDIHDAKKKQTPLQYFLKTTLTPTGPLTDGNLCRHIYNELW